MMDLLGHSTIRLTADTYGHFCRRAHGALRMPSIECWEEISDIARIALGCSQAVPVRNC